MYIKSCYIEGFGKLHEFNIEFNSGLNVIKEDNGWGKTTLMAFIKAMLYGMTYRPNSKEFCDRKRYEPWDGGKFGGYMIFEICGGEYKVTRFFGKKDVQDEFELIDMRTGKESEAYSERLGEEIFGIDMESFERSVYISGDKKSSITDGINAKLNNLIENADDIGNYDSAYDTLDKLIRKLYKRGSGGDIQKKKELIRELEDKCKDCESKSQLIELYQKNIEEYLLKKQDCENNIRIIDDSIAKIELYNKREQYNNLKHRIDEVRAKLEGFGRFFNKHEPNEQELIKFNNICSGIAALNNSIEALGPVREYDEDEEVHIDKCMDIYNEASELSIKLKSEKANYDSLYKEYEATKAESEKLKNKKYNIWLPIILLIISVGAIIYGSVDLAKEPAKHNAVLIVVGATVIAVVTGILLIMAFVKNGKLKRMRDEILRRKEEYRDLIAKKEHLITKLKEEKRVLEANYSTYIERKLTMPTGNVIKDLSKIRDNVIKYNSFKEYTKELYDKEKLLTGFLNYYDCGQNNTTSYYEMLQEIRDNLRDYNFAQINYDRLRRELEEFERSVDLEKISSLKDEAMEYTDVVTLQQQRREWQIETERQTGLINRAEKTIEDISLEVDRKQEYESEIGRLREEVATLEEKYRIFTITRDALAAAKENLSTRYMNSMKTAFEKYVNIFDIPDNVKLGLDLTTKMEKNGKDWDSKYFSAGYGDMIDICVRFALVDAMFEEEKPPIVLDDPFVNFDDEKLIKVKKAMEDISKDKQIIYTVCHSARKL